jgi:hypothetical protein
VPDTIGGVPVHPLVVHAVVVLLPLAAVGVILIAAIPRWRAAIGFTVLAITAVGTALVPIATMSGNNLAASIGTSPLVAHHQQLGNTLWYVAVPLLLVSVLLWWLGRRERHEQPLSTAASVAVGMLSVLVAAATIVQVVRVGHSGADAVWSGVLTSVNMLVA